MEPASSRALGIAHLVANVLHQSQDHQLIGRASVAPLSRYASVNKLWADEVTEMIWAELSTLEPLELVRPERRQYYARKIRTLRVALVDPRVPSATACLSDLELPRLREVELRFHYDATPQHIPPVLTSKLRSVAAIIVRCQRLKAFNYTGPSHHLVPKRLLDLFMSQRSTLSDIRIHMTDSLTQNEVSEDLVTYLAEQSVVRNIRAPQLKLHAPPRFAIANPFQALELLDIKADYDSLYAISASLPELRTLQINLVPNQAVVSEPLAPILSRLAASTKLEILKIERRSQPRESGLEVQTPVIISGAAFAEFAQSCRSLRKFCLEIQPGMVAEDFTASHLLQASSSLQCLQEVGLFLTPESSSLTAATVSIFGQYCPDLECCHILGEFTVLDIDWGTEAIFPKLRRLSLNQIRGYQTNWSLDVFDSKLRKKFPRLELLQVMRAFPGPLSISTSYLYDVPQTPRSHPSS
ncbi:leucine-rich repeat-containing protein 16a q5vzk9 [Diplodia corticola]|uniref:Leucine-rich repeat-containing protein 16a q5vzk9 n=1 Tax=Diplodia corticola TaxID=236234 RepID=A0A1J9S4F1_9PEZI|nr:leucine-rich repeat-containing protein 16a q5vzk9 [Diplodia corticola]OJD34509.1 leucine-rich repeat-containing protein 16a q5vzk9 [Diplodia corticola]